ncbi:MAG TPA: acyltransferase family protein [Acidimicrobiia bacterium]|nr:acyltransferase family protein [Acidimicrobiia bacterium]
MRCVAVYLVVAFHAGLRGFGGGFIGVDVFFVLSGFLVTGILMRDLVASGRVDLRRFYARRVRRILPASLVALVVVALVYAIVAAPAEMDAVAGGFKASFLFVANWYFVRQSVDYFATSVDQSPVLHFWSLAVEEQFYLVWPLLFGGLFIATARLGRLRWWVLRALVGSLGTASLLLALHIGATNVDRAYYGTDTRAYQLLAGALLALMPQLMRAGRELRTLFRLAIPVAFAALLLFASGTIDLSPITRGSVAVVLTLALIVGMENGRETVFTRLLGSPPVAYLGRVSFATYLWHWPVVVIATHARHIAPVPLFVLSAVLSTLLAIASYHLLEHPIRASTGLDHRRMRVIAVGLGVSLVCAFLVVPGIVDREEGTTTTAISPTGARIKLDWRAALNDIPRLPDCVGRSLDQCRVVKGSGKTMILAGDSNARMWIPAFAAIARANGMSLYVSSASGCPWERGLLLDLGASAPEIITCREHQADFYDRMLPLLSPALVVAVDVAYDGPVLPKKLVAPNGDHITLGDPRLEADLARASKSSLAAMRAPGRKVVVVEPIPVAPTDPLACLSKGGPIDRCKFATSLTPLGLERYIRSLANGTHLFSIDADLLTCPRRPFCDAVVDGLIVKRDLTHLTGTFAAHLAPKMEVLLRQAGVLSASGQP